MGTKESAKQQLEGWVAKANAYKQFFKYGSKDDDAIYGNLGAYTAGKERSLINRKVRIYKKILADWPENATGFEFSWFGSWDYFNASNERIGFSSLQS